MAAGAYRHSSLSWPPTEEQWQAVNDEFENIYKLLRAGNAPGSVTSTALSTTGVTSGSYGTAARSITESVGTDGRITLISDQLIAIDASQISSGALLPVRGGTGQDFSGAAKGDLIVGTAAGTFGRKAVGADGQMIQADSASTGGMKWTTGPAQAVIGETPSGSINGSNTVFTTANAYVGGSLQVYLNGQRQTKGTDYTETSSTTCTFTNAPHTGDTVYVDYNRVTAGSVTPSGLVLLAELTAAASASLNFFSRNVAGQSGNLFQTDYDDYLIEVVGLVPATNNVGISLRVSTDGSTWVSTGSYDWTHWVYGPAGTGQTANTSQTEIRVLGFVNASNTGTFSVNATIHAFSPLSTALWKIFNGQTAFWDTGPGLVVDIWSGAYRATTAIVGIQVLATSGNLTSGTVRVYGVAK